MNTPLREVCHNKWPGLLAAVGIDRAFLTGKHGPCPLCPGGEDRFRFDDKDGRGTWICSKCGAGDGIALVMGVKGWDFKDAAAELERLAGVVPVVAAKVKRSEQDMRDAMTRLWREGKPLSIGDDAAAYLKARGIDLTEWPTSLRLVERCRYQDRDGSASWHPAMLAKVCAPDGKPVQVHRTYLGTRCKADVPEARKLMPGALPKGSAVRLAPPTEVMGISTGIETSLSAGILFRVPVWAALNDANLMTWEPPSGVKVVIVFGDPDAKFSGQAASYGLAKRLAGQQERFRLDEVRVEIPAEVGCDWNDMLMAERRIAA